jgi:galactokinase
MDLRDDSDDPGRGWTLGDFALETGWERRLGRLEVMGRAARFLADLFTACAGSLLDLGVKPDAEVRAHFVPGRIEVLGKHTDYCGGRSLVAATEQGFAFLAAAAEGTRIEMVDALRRERVEFELLPDLMPAQGHWSNYPMTVARRMARNFPGPRVGARLAFGSNLPPAAGMSSSSALMIGTFQALAGLQGVRERGEYRSSCPSPEALASYLATVENGSDFGTLKGDRGVGTQGGSEDHTAILCSRRGALGLCSYQPVKVEDRIAFPDGFTLAVASSGITAEKTGAAMELYNRASRLARALVEIWNTAEGAEEPHLKAVLSSSAGAPARLRGLIGRGSRSPIEAVALLDRLEHFVWENERILPGAVRALRAQDLPEFGRWVDASQEWGERLLGNQVPETVFLAREARRQGASAASAFGAGFGGSVWAMVRKADVRSFLEAWEAGYRRAFPAAAEKAAFFTTDPSGPAMEALR